MNPFIIRLSLAFLLLHLVACEQLGLSGTEPAVTLTPEQHKAKILLQQQLDEVKQSVAQVQAVILKSREQLAILRSENKDRFIDVQIESAGKTSLGSEQARVAMIVFTDYQCPACARHVTELLPRLKRDYIDTGKLRYILHDFPLAIHGQAKYAAVVANCAGEQGRYWKMHDLLFKNQRRLDPRLYLNLASDIGLEPGQLSDCLTNPDSVTQVDKDVLYGQSLGVSDAPEFFVGRIEGNRLTDVIMVRHTQPFKDLETAIDILIEMDAADTTMKSAHLNKIAHNREITRLENELGAFK